MGTNSNKSLDNLVILSSGEALRIGKSFIANRQLEELDKILSSEYLNVKDRKNLTDSNIVYLTNAKRYNDAVKFALDNQYTTKEVWNMIDQIKGNREHKFDEPETELGIYYD